MEEQVQRKITVILPSGEEVEWWPPHMPVNQQNGSLMIFIWEREDGLIENVAINLEQIIALEVVSIREDEDEEVMALIDKVKGRDAG